MSCSIEAGRLAHRPLLQVLHASLKSLCRFYTRLRLLELPAFFSEGVVVNRCMVLSRNWILSQKYCWLPTCDCPKNVSSRRFGSYLCVCMDGWELKNGVRSLPYLVTSRAVSHGSEKAPWFGLEFVKLFSLSSITSVEVTHVKFWYCTWIQIFLNTFEATQAASVTLVTWINPFFQNCIFPCGLSLQVETSNKNTRYAHSPYLSHKILQRWLLCRNASTSTNATPRDLHTIAAWTRTATTRYAAVFAFFWCIVECHLVCNVWWHGVLEACKNGLSLCLQQRTIEASIFTYQFLSPSEVPLAKTLCSCMSTCTSSLTPVYVFSTHQRA